MNPARWFYVENEARLGPVDFEQLVQLLASGSLPADTLVWHHGMKAWSEAQEIPEIAEHLPPPLPPDAAPPDVPPPIPSRNRPAASAEPIIMVEPDAEPSEPFRLHAVDRPGGKAGSSPAPASDPAPIPVVAADEPFEIERAGEYAVPSKGGRPAPAKDSPAKAAAPPTKEAVIKDVTSRDAPAKPVQVKDTPTIRPSPAASSAPAGKTASIPSAPPTSGKAASAAQETRPPAIIPPPAVVPPPPAVIGTPAVVGTPAVIGVPAVIGAPATVPPPVPSKEPRPHTVAWPNGRLADHDFPDLVREVYSRSWSGLLTLNHMGVEKSVRVHEGRLVFASSSSRDDRLGELLLRKGRISLHQFVAASRAIRKNKRLGTILVEEGALDPRELVKVVTEHTQEIIHSAFQWTEGMYHFTEGDASPEEITLKLSTPDIIMEGMRRIEAWSRIERGVGSMDTRYTRDEHFDKILTQLNLSIEKLSILTGLTAIKDVGTICRESNLSHFEVCRTLWSFRVIGVVRRLS